MNKRLLTAVCSLTLIGAACATDSTTTSGGKVESGATTTSVKAKPKAAPLPTLAAPGVEHEHGGEGYHEAPPVELSAEDQVKFDDEMKRAKLAVSNFPTAADASAAGYLQVGVYYPGIGAHYLNPLLLSLPFNVDLPPLLLFDGTDPDSKIVGLSYLVKSGILPEGFTGPNDHWHTHQGSCYKDDEQIEIISFGGITEEDCDAFDGHYLNDVFAMNHVWNVEGHESPDGMFSAVNPSLTCADGTIDYDVLGCLDDPDRADS